jgi:hypothetical protein
MSPIVTIHEITAASMTLQARDVRDVSHIRRLCLQAACAVEGDTVVEVSRVRLAALRGYLTEQGCSDKRAARRLLLMALLEMEDEDDEQRFLVSHPVLPVLTLGR